MFSNLIVFKLTKPAGLVSLNFELVNRSKPWFIQTLPAGVDIASWTVIAPRRDKGSSRRMCWRRASALKKNSCLVKTLSHPLQLKRWQLCSHCQCVMRILVKRPSGAESDIDRDRQGAPPAPPARSAPSAAACLCCSSSFCSSFSSSTPAAPARSSQLQDAHCIIRTLGKRVEHGQASDLRALVGWRGGESPEQRLLGPPASLPPPL